MNLPEGYIEMTDGHQYYDGRTWRSYVAVNNMNDVQVARSSIAKNIINALSSNGYAFGGYVMSRIRGEDFSNLDMFFPMSDPNFRPIDLSTLCNKIANLGYTIERDNFHTYEHFNRFNCLVKDANGITLYFNVVRPPNLDIKDPFDHCISDIECIMLKHNIYQVPDYVNRSALNTIENIKKRQYKILDGRHTNTIFLDKFKDYKNITSPNNVIDSNQSLKVSKMSDTDFQARPSIITQFKSDMEDALYRSAGKQMTDVVKQGILTTMRNQGTDEGSLLAFAKMLDTELGSAAVSAILGQGLQYAPVIGSDPRAEKLAKEFRVAGYSNAMNIIFASVMQNIMPGLVAAMQTLPPLNVTQDDLDEVSKASKYKPRLVDFPNTYPAKAVEELDEVDVAVKRTQKVQ